MTTEVRLVTAADEEAMMTLLTEMHAENGMADMNVAKVHATLWRGINRQYGLIGVIRGPEAIEASIGLFIGGFWYSDHQHLEDLWCFVSEPYRRTVSGQDGHAKKLIQFAKWASGELGKPLMMGVLSTSRTQAKVRLYSREFGKPAGAMFITNGRLPDPIADMA